MQTSSRLYQCTRCHAQVIICSDCDRGQRYCNDGCARDARTDSLKRATRKYQLGRAGRFNNASRQQRFRQRKKQKVTYQGSALKRLRDLLKTRLTQLKKVSRPSFPGTGVYCHHCGALCEPFLRHDFLHSSRYSQILRRYDPF